MSTPTQRPEGALIERLRTDMRPTMSARAAAKAAGMSPSRWTQIAQGYKQETKELRVPVRAPADTLARMAQVVGATSDQLREVGRGDAADELESISVADPVKAEFGLSVTPTLGGPPSIARLAQDSLVKVYLASQQRPAADRAELFLDELFRAINLCRTVVVNDPDQTVRANAADVLAYAEAAAGFLKMTIAEIKGERHVVATAQESPASSEASSHEKTDAEDRSADNSQSRTAFDDLDAATDGAIPELDVDGVDDDGQQFG